MVEVRLAPLTEVQVGGERFRWYDPAALEDLHGVGVVFVDGPPGDAGPLSRLPALPLLAERCAPEAVFLLDDADRPDEQEILARWESQHGATPLAGGTGEPGWRSVAIASRTATKAV